MSRPTNSAGIRKLTTIAMLVSLGIVLQIVESIVPIPVNLPGGKLGLANIATVIVLFIFDWRSALLVAVLRSFLGSMLYGGVSAMIYSVSGSVISMAVMSLFMRFGKQHLSLVGISVMGSVFHNTAQVTVAALILNNLWIYSYLPALAIVACVTGMFTGLAANTLVKYRFKSEK